MILRNSGPSNTQTMTKQNCGNSIQYHRDFLSACIFRLIFLYISTYYCYHRLCKCETKYKCADCDKTE